MRTSATCRRERVLSALGAALTLLAIGTAAHAQNGLAARSDSLLEDLLARVGDRIEQYFARAQKIVFLEKTTISYIGTDLTPQGFWRVLESDVRVEASPADGDSDGSSETSVVRELRKINGRAPRPRDDRSNCLDPNPISPEPLAFLLPAQRGDYEFTWVGHGKGKEQRNVLIDFRELGSGNPSVRERTDRGEGCFTIDIPGRARGRVWIDASTYDVLRVDQRIYGLVDFRLPDPKNRRGAIDDRQVLERLDTSIRYKTVPFRDPEETVLLPESIDTLMVVRGMQSYRMKQVFSEYRRFVTDARLVK
jgi:hypothetical protein